MFIMDHKREWSQLKKKYTEVKRDKNNIPLINSLNNLGSNFLIK